mgnify:CR=1 FL=1
MAYAKYNLNGREMLNLDNLGVVDYNEFYSILYKSYERRENISKKYTALQNAKKLENEPSIDYSVLYQRFLEELKSINPDMYNHKSTLLKDYLNELKEEENIFKEEKEQLLSKGYLFNDDLKHLGYYIIKIDDDYFQYKLITTENVMIDMGDKLFHQTASISRYEFVPLTIIDLLQIKKKILREKHLNARRRAKIQGLFKEDIIKKTK